LSDFFFTLSVAIHAHIEINTTGITVVNPQHAISV